MTLMIPPNIHRDIASSAEKKIFEQIKNNPNLNETICFHSLGLARHESKRHGELDFLLLDKWGITCLEVKGGRVKCQDGIWKFTDRYGRENTKRESPFNQVSSGGFSLKGELQSKFDFGSKIRLGYGVMFPDIEFKKDSPEWDEEYVYDIDDFKKPINYFTKRLKDFWEKRSKKWERDLSSEEIEKIQYYLRGDFEMIVPLWKKIKDTEEEIIRLTNEQCKALDSMVENKRIFFKGAAGTGKTVLAFEQAKRLAASGKSVLFLCFNKILGKKLYLEAHKSEFADKIFASSIHIYFSVAMKNGKFYDEFKSKKYQVSSDEYLKKMYCDYFIKSISAETKKYDCLIIDEGQDILCKEYFTALDKILKNGIKNGQWYIFYDSNNQGKLYQNFDEKFYNKMKEDGAANYNLDLNCRNTKPIAVQTAALSSFPMASTLIETGESVSYKWYESRAHMIRLLSDAINKFLKGGIRPDEITILYPGGYNEVKDSIYRSEFNADIKELTPETLEENDNKIQICTTQAFKGMENKVIIYYGIDRINSDWIDTLNYVGMSRAREVLCVILDEKLKSEYSKKIDIFINNNTK